jgi:hypothetical protein
MTAMSGLKTFEPVTAEPYTGSGPVGPPAPSAPEGTWAVGGGRRRAFRRHQLCLERRQPIAVLLLELVEIPPQLIDFLAQGLRRVLRERVRRGEAQSRGHHRRAHESHGSHGLLLRTARLPAFRVCRIGENV